MRVHTDFAAAFTSGSSFRTQSGKRITASVREVGELPLMAGCIAFGDPSDPLAMKTSVRSPQDATPSSSRSVGTPNLRRPGSDSRRFKLYAGTRRSPTGKISMISSLESFLVLMWEIERWPHFSTPNCGKHYIRLQSIRSMRSLTGTLSVMLGAQRFRAANQSPYFRHPALEHTQRTGDSLSTTTARSLWSI